MNLWINPFLDVFYEWGENKYWITKADFLDYLNYSWASRLDWSSERPKGAEVDGAIQDYLKEMVPKWYYRFGFSMDIGGKLGMDIDPLFPDILECWEKDLPYRVDNRVTKYPESHYFTDLLQEKMYEGYPNELMIESDVNNNKFFLDLYNQNDQHNGWVQLIHINNTVLNSLYFTTQKGKSWCDVTPLPKFMNWIDENPFKVVKE